MHRVKTRSGFTLIELLLTVSIASLLLLSISFFLSVLYQSRVKQQTIAEVEQQGGETMRVITQAIRNAESISAPAAGTDSGSLTLDVAEAAADPTVFDSASGALRIQEGAGSAVLLTNSRVTVSDLSFSNVSRAGTPGIIRIQYTLTHQNPEGRNEYQYQKTFSASAALRQP